MRLRTGVLVLALVASACGSTARIPDNVAAAGAGDELGDSASAPTPAAGGTSDVTTSGTAARGTTAAGATRATVSPKAVTSGRPVNTPIELGFVRTGVSNAAAFGASLGGTASEADIVSALVAAYNDQGGIAGRRIVPVYADTDTGSSSWDADFAAACASFTQDHKVAAVLGYVFTHIDSFESCLAKRNIPHLSTTFNVPDAPTLSRYPMLMALSTPLIERRSIAKVDGGLATGALTRASKLGIVLDACPGTNAAWNKITKPYLESKGLTVAATFEVGCASGSGDAAAEAGRSGNLVLQFRTAGVDTVMIMSVSEGPALFIFAGAAEAQGYRPRYVVSSLANTAILANQLPPRQAANVDGYGWLPVQDVKPPYWPGLPAPATRCLNMLKTKSITPAASADFAFAFSACEALFLYEVALKANQGRSDGAAIISTIESLGTGFTSVANLDGRSAFSKDRHDAPAQARHFAWTPGCSCFTYRTSTSPMR